MLEWMPQGSEYPPDQGPPEKKLPLSYMALLSSARGMPVLRPCWEWMPQGSEYPPTQPEKRFTTFSRSQRELPALAAHPAPCTLTSCLISYAPGRCANLVYSCMLMCAWCWCAVLPSP